MSPDAIAIRDAAIELFSGMVGPAPALFRYVDKIPVEQEPDDQLPSLLIIAMREQMQPDGDLNAGEPAFVNDLTLACLISVSGNERTGADEKLSRRVSAVMSTLLTTTSFLAMVEGFSGVTATRSFDKDGERFFARARVDVLLQYRTDWPPVVTDDFLSVELAGRPVPGGEHTPPANLKITLTAS